MRSRRLTFLPVLALLVPVAPARAATTTVYSAANTFSPGNVTVKPGDGLELFNADAAPHNIVSDALNRKGAQLFRSDTITAGERAPVKGVEKLAAGSYTFYCSVHPQMRGSVTVGNRAAAIVPTPSGAVVPTPTSITLFGDSLYVTSWARGDVTRLPVLSGGLLGPPATYASGFTSPLGLVFGPDGTLFVADSHDSDDRVVGRVWAIPPGGGAATQGKVVVDGLPNGRHNTNGIAVRAGRLYITNGNSTDDGVHGGPAEQPLSGTLLSVPLKARGVPARAGRDLVVEARGMRNPFDVAFRPGTAEAWIPTNGPDMLDPYGEDLLHMVDVRKSAADFGFPACVYKTEANGTLAYAQNTNVKQKCSSRHRRPETAFGLHVSANGLAFGPTDGGWNGDLFVAEYGANGGNQGHKIVRVPITRGHAGKPEDVLFAASPLDLCFGPAGTGLYVADFASGAITLLRPVG